jgi:HSP20 family protein
MTRRLRVPDWVDGERVSADCSDGVLTVLLPVAERAKPRRIEIRPAGAGEQTSIGSSAGASVAGESAAS